MRLIGYQIALGLLMLCFVQMNGLITASAETVTSSPFVDSTTVFDSIITATSPVLLMTSSSPESTETTVTMAFAQPSSSVEHSLATEATTTINLNPTPTNSELARTTDTSNLGVSDPSSPDVPPVATMAVTGSSALGSSRQQTSGPAMTNTTSDLMTTKITMISTGSITLDSSGEIISGVSSSYTQISSATSEVTLTEIKSSSGYRESSPSFTGSETVSGSPASTLTTEVTESLVDITMSSVGDTRMLGAGTSSESVLLPESTYLVSTVNDSPGTSFEISPSSVMPSAVELYISETSLAISTEATMSSESIPVFSNATYPTTSYDAESTFVDLNSSVIDASGMTSVSVSNASVDFNYTATGTSFVRSSASGSINTYIASSATESLSTTSVTSATTKPTFTQPPGRTQEQKLSRLGISLTIVIGGVSILVVFIGAIHWCLNRRPKLKTEKLDTNRLIEEPGQGINMTEFSDENGQTSRGMSYNNPLAH